MVHSLGLMHAPLSSYLPSGKSKKHKRDDDILGDEVAISASTSQTHSVKKRKIQKGQPKKDRVVKKGSCLGVKRPLKKTRVIVKKLKIKDLPQPVLEKIISFLPHKEGIRTRLVNKAFSLVRRTPQDSEVLARLQKLKEEKPEGWQQKAVKLLRQNRHEDISSELARLKLMGFSDERDRMLKKALDDLHRHIDNNLKVKVLLGQAFEIKDLYAKTHDVFIHAQAIRWVVLPHLIKELIKKFDPQKVLGDFKFLRLPQSYAQSSGKVVRSVEDFIKSLPRVDDSDPKIATLLLSVDAYYYNSRCQESALDFLISNENITNEYEKIADLAKEVIQCFCPKIKAKDQDRVLKKLKEASEVHEQSLWGSCGNLFVFCIPKKNSTKIQYRAHAFGYPCFCHSTFVTPRVILNRLQQEYFGKDVECIRGVVPQYRLYTPLLTPEMGVRSYLLTLATKKERTILKKSIKAVVNEVYAIHQSQQTVVAKRKLRKK